LTRPFVLWGIAAVAALVAVEWLLKHEELRSPAKSILGFLPALMVIFMVVAILQDVRKLDEMGRRLHMQAAAISFLLTIILTFVFDGLAGAGIYSATRSDLNTATVSIWAAVFIFLSLRH